jgi:hypothetical protein
MIGYDRSFDLSKIGYEVGFLIQLKTTDFLQRQIEFLRKNILISSWTRFNQLSIFNYANDELASISYGIIRSLEDARDFVQAFNQVVYVHNFAVRLVF